jgi:hypothetical protein
LSLTGHGQFDAFDNTLGRALRLVCVCEIVGMQCIRCGRRAHVVVRMLEAAVVPTADATHGSTTQADKTADTSKEGERRCAEPDASGKAEACGVGEWR